MSLGKILARTAVKQEKHTTWFPSYGAEVRGGTAHCFVRISDNPIASPFAAHPEVVIAFNQPSLDKFEKRLKKGGLLIVNADLRSGDSHRKDVVAVDMPFNKIALECGNIRVANTVALGVLSVLKPELLDKETVLGVLGEFFKRQDILNQNIKAFKKGIEIAKG